MDMMVMECARSTRLHVGLPLNMWTKVVNTTVYFIDRGPSTPLGCGILDEAWTGKKLKCLRSDNGGEYCSHEFEYY